jgi:hypothetical protein
MSKIEKIITLFDGGLRTGEIYQKMRGETTYGTIVTTISKHRKNRGLSAKDEKRRVVNVEMTGAEYSILSLEAEERNTTPEALAKTLFLEIINDDLFKAVLDK